MDATVAGALSTAVTGFKTDSISQLGSILPIALPVAITVALVFMGVRWFRSLAHV